MRFPQGWLLVVWVAAGVLLSACSNEIGEEQATMPPGTGMVTPGVGGGAPAPASAPAQSAAGPIGEAAALENDQQSAPVGLELDRRAPGMGPVAGPPRRPGGGRRWPGPRRPGSGRRAQRIAVGRDGGSATVTDFRASVMRRCDRPAACRP